MSPLLEHALHSLAEWSSLSLQVNLLLSEVMGAEDVSVTLARAKATAVIAFIVFVFLFLGVVICDVCSVIVVHAVWSSSLPFYTLSGVINICFMVLLPTTFPIWG